MAKKQKPKTEEPLPMLNGHDKSVDIDGLTKQRVYCGAAILLSPDVMKHGIAMVHPDLPLFTLHFELDEKTKVLKHTFELVKPKTPMVKDYEIEVIRTEPTVAVPKKELIIP